MRLFGYDGAPLPARLDAHALRRAASDYRAIILTNIHAIADRCEQSDAPFIDTKLSLVTGEDFLTSDPVRGTGTVYGWIQGRGLESMAGHARWLRGQNDEADFVRRLRSIAGAALDQLRKMRDRNGGRLSFFMQPDGTPFLLNEGCEPAVFELEQDAPYGFSDLFSAKGMLAAAVELEDAAATSEALDYVESVEDAIWSGRFRSDQISLDPKNPVEPTEGHHPHGPYMIQIGACALLVALGYEDGVERGLRLIEHELDRHVYSDGEASFEAGDLWEAVNDDGAPYRSDDGVIFSDPGHALEFVGLASKLIHVSGERGRATAAGERFASSMGSILGQNFANGFQDPPGGICKAYDLVSRRVLNSDIPWWSLPETIRAATYVAALTGVLEEQEQALSILGRCHNGFVGHFVRRDLHLMAYQTIDVEGRPVDVIPATSDVDPGYHTGLSLIDAHDQLIRLAEQV